MAIQTVRQRDALEPRREPYWHAMSKGAHIGYRKTDEGGHWIARAYDPGTSKRNYKALNLAETAGADQFSAAAKAAREWFVHMGKGGRADALTVAAACELYVDHVRAKKGEAAADDAQGRIRRHVIGDEIAKIELAKLQARHVKAWRKRLENNPAAQPKRGPKCRVASPKPPRQPRSPSSINRDMVALRAALNLAYADGYVTSNMAWRVPLEPLEGADGRRTTYLNRTQRKALLKALPADDIRHFVRGLCLLPLRPGALAKLKARDFDARDGTLSITKDKAGQGRKILLPKPAAKHLKAMAKDKLPNAPLFSRWNGSAWDKDSWKVPIKAAAASVDPSASAYTLRHSTITDLISAGLDLFTVAALSGTSIAMIEKHYGHLQQDRAQKALDGLSL